MGKQVTSGDGRVMVFCRSRPMLSREQGDLAAVEMGEDGEVIVRQAVDPLSILNEKKEVQIERKEKLFKVDGAFPEDATQKEVFQVVGLPVLVECMQGFNGCIFAYGQTGSGKTHSMMGDSQVTNLEDVGLLPRITATLFARAAMDKKFVYSIQCAAFQIYNETIDDLLHPEHKQGKGANLQVAPGGMVKNMTWNECKTPGEMLDLFKEARNQINYAETKMNKASSRSHAVFQIKILKRPRQHQDSSQQQQQGNVNVRATCGMLSVIDLAGSERVKRSGVTGKNFVEATNINGSLLALGNVIQALAEKKSHIPYRDSKLTRVLEGSVGGNSKTTLLVCVSPAETSTSETMSTLEFAARAMRVEVSAKINETVIELDASALAADMEENAEPVIDEEMLKNFKESEAALKEAQERALLHEKEKEDLKNRVNEFESQLKGKTEEINNALKESKKKESQINMLRDELSRNEKKHTEDMAKAQAVVDKLTSQVSFQTNEIKIQKKTLKELTEKLNTNQREKKVVEEKLVQLQQEMVKREEATKQTIEKLVHEKEQNEKVWVQKLQEEQFEQEKLKKEIEEQVSKQKQLHATVQTLSKVKDNLDNSLKDMGSSYESINSMLEEERAKVSRLEIIQEEAKELRLEVDRRHAKELELQKQLAQMQSERGDLSNTVCTLELKVQSLNTNYEVETKKRHALEEERQTLKQELQSTCDGLMEKSRELEDTKKTLSKEIENLKTNHEQVLHDHRQQSIAEVQRKEKNHKEALSALEQRAHQDQIKNRNKIQQIEQQMQDLQNSYEQQLAEVKDHHERKLAEEMDKERTKHQKQVQHLEQQIENAICNLSQSEKEHLRKEKELEVSHQQKLRHAQAAHETAREALRADFQELENDFNRLRARFAARESRKEDLELIAQQQQQIRELQRIVKSAKKQTKQHELELRHYKDNMRIFGSIEQKNKDPKALPGHKFNDRDTFLGRRQKSIQKNINIPTTYEEERSVGILPQAQSRPSTTQGTSRPIYQNQTSSPIAYDNFRPETSPPINNAVVTTAASSSRRPLPVPPQ